MHSLVKRVMFFAFFIPSFCCASTPVQAEIDSADSLAPSIEMGCQRPLQGPPGPIGPRGPRGRRGFGPFIHDLGQQLLFIQNGTVTLGPVLPGLSIILTPFVSGPDGSFFPGIPMDVSAGGDFNGAPILVPNPVFGTYRSGLLIETFNASGSDLVMKRFPVISSRYGNTQTYAAPDHILVPANGEFNSQIGSHYTYATPPPLLHLP